MICSITFSPCDPEDLGLLDLKTLKGRSYWLPEREKHHQGGEQIDGRPVLGGRGQLLPNRAEGGCFKLKNKTFLENDLKLVNMREV